MTTEIKDEKPTHTLEELEVYKVDIVGAPATGERFIQIRSEDGGEMPKRTAMRASTAKKLADDKGEVPTDKEANFFDINIQRGGVINLHTEKTLPEKKLQKPVERTVDDNDNDNSNEPSEKENMGNLEKEVDRLSAVVKRMEESLFKNVVGTETTTEDPEKDKETLETETANQETSEQSTTETPVETPVEAPVPAPVAPVAPVADSSTEQPAVAPVATETPALVPVETPVNAPVETPVPAAEGDVSALTSTVERLSGIVEKVGGQIGEMNKTMGKMNERVDSVERSIKSGGNALETDETESVERGGTESVWAGVLF